MQMNIELFERKSAVLENLQEEIIKAGGCFMKQDRLEAMTVTELLETIIPNSIDVKFRRLTPEL
jgi:hypothetical protein